MVRVRGFRDVDADAIAVMMDDEEMSRWTRTPWPYRHSDALSWLATHPAMQKRGEALNLAIVEEATGDLVGSIGLRPRGEGRGELGYLVARWARRRGFATRAVRLYARWAFESLDLERIEVLVRPENLASLAMTERLGFRREGVLRSHSVIRGERVDMVSFGLLPGELRE